MSDTPPTAAAEGKSSSQTNLIDVQHVGVTAKLHSPLQDLLLNYSSSTENEQRESIYQPTRNTTTKYNKFSNESAANGTASDSTLTDQSKILYEMRTDLKSGKKNKKSTMTPTKIEFQLYKQKAKKKKTKSEKTKRKLFETKEKKNQKSSTIFENLRHSFGQMKAKQQPQQPSVPTDKIFDNLSNLNFQPEKEVRIGIYPFDHGNAEYLQTHDCPPHIHSLALAERTNDLATKFWAEFFGSLHIGVAFVVAFILQCYRFVLYSLVNTLMVGLLHMTADYFLKPLLTVTFNGFLQPPMIFLFNFLSSWRDILEPISDTLNNFMKPLGTVARSLRLVHVTYNKKNITKNV
ncbi:uncharacterized protein LOC133329350 [Musca vetustissima]|uniref:uncharacterized protein LOC133329350 n=1 Tax=Musca vetustissima TaxID=27455 RepID=UPI002AB614AD|nr:uncharacterized protein LOC133329350 [Musca vetustissima]